MGFIDKIKQFFGIGGVKLQLMVPTDISKAAATVAGTVILTSKSDQKVLSLEYWFEQRTTTGTGNNKKVSKKRLAESKDMNGFDIKAGERKEVGFSMELATEEQKKEAEGVFGAIAQVGGALQALQGKKLEYLLWVSCDVDGVTMDPNASQVVNLV